MQRNTDKPLTYLEDVLKEALRKSDFNTDKYLTYNKALEAVKLMFEYIVFETNQEQVDAIDLPKLGILYKNLRYLKNGEKDKEGKINSKIKELQYFCDDNGINAIHNRVPLTFSFDKKIREQFEIDRVSRRLSKPNLDIISATEKLQNK
jgi:transposase-like protein